MDDFLEKLNDIKVDISEYEEIKVHDIEKLRAKKRISKKLKSKKSIGSGVVKVAAMMVLVLSLPILAEGVSATVKLVNKSIESLGGYNEGDLKEYKQVINSVASNKEYTVQLNEVMFDMDCLVVSSTVTKNNNEELSGEKNYGMVLEKIYINGKKLGDAITNYSEDYNGKGYTNLSRAYYGEELQLSGDVEVELVYSNSADGSRYEPIKFKIHGNTEKMKSEIELIDVNKEIVIDGKKEAAINKISISPTTVLLEGIVMETSEYGVKYLIKNIDGELVRAEVDLLENNTEYKAQYYLETKDVEKIVIVPVAIEKSTGREFELKEQSIEVKVDK